MYSSKSTRALPVNFLPFFDFLPFFFNLVGASSSFFNLSFDFPFFLGATSSSSSSCFSSSLIVFSSSSSTGSSCTVCFSLDILVTFLLNLLARIPSDGGLMNSSSSSSLGGEIGSSICFTLDNFLLLGTISSSSSLTSSLFFSSSTSDISGSDSSGVISSATSTS
ncbi:hypothetical protein J437_LFUL013831 [Ladona fulva]|uniref:Uncharacterized protein n=1 Tax=Ladona fulva TaxID=123851 RepID=A0A8K0KGS5_LADFU|nr:hypothetical protein J437_LFUL013831 [Ladona fulva]